MEIPRLSRTSAPRRRVRPTGRPSRLALAARALALSALLLGAESWSQHHHPQIAGGRDVEQALQARGARRPASHRRQRAVATRLFSSVADPSSSPVDDVYYSPAAPSYAPPPPAAQSPSSEGGTARITLTRWLSAKVQDYPELRDMESLHLSIQMACKTISNLIHSSTASTATGRMASTRFSGAGAGDDAKDTSMKRLDQISKNVLQSALRFTGRLRVVEAPYEPGEDDDGGGSTSVKKHQPGVTIAYALDQYSGRGGDDGGSRKGGEEGGVEEKWTSTRRLAACFDPLDGSGNADASICTGTVFGVFDADAGFRGGESPDLRDASSLSRAVLQPGNKLLAAGYCLYSSTTMLVFTLGGGTHGFTLDTAMNEFVLTHPNMRIPSRGSIYSCNESYSEGWSPDFRRYLSAIKGGRGQSGERYTQRYIGSMVGDVHRTLMYGGIFACPADDDVHPRGSLQLVHKSAPMAFLIEHAGGRSADDSGARSLLDVVPSRVHERCPCFMGSSDDMDELAGYLRG